MSHERRAMSAILAVFLLGLAGCSQNSGSSQSGQASSSGPNPPAFTYSGAPIVNTYAPANGASAVSSNYFGMTIHHLASNTPGAQSNLTPFPSFSVSTFRFWDVAYWQLLEPAKGTFNWTKMDGTLQAAQSNGVSDFIFTFGNVPAWASTNASDPCIDGEGAGTCAPPDMSAFDDFATHVVQRYCGKVKNYETWNEPNNSFFWDGTKTQLLTVAQHLDQIAKDPANCGCTDGSCSPGGGVNPNRVLLPSISKLTASNLSWLDGYLATAGATYPYADIAAFHGYGNDTDPENIASQVQQLQTTLGKHGLSGLELWNTEASWGEETSQVGQDQASWLMRYHVVQAAAGVSRFVWYAYDNCNWGTLWSVSPCGNSDATASALAVPGSAYSVIESWMTGAVLTDCTQYQNGLWACKFVRDGDYAGVMLWSSSGASISVSIPSSAGLTIYRDWQNNINALPTQLTVNQMPVLLETRDL